jgi:hypothetical protein
VPDVTPAGPGKTPPSLPAAEPAPNEILFSAFIFPGAGQWLQGRRAACAVFMVPTILLAVALAWIILTPVVINIGYMVNWPGIDESRIVGPMALLRVCVSPLVLKILLLGLAIYVAAVVDAAVVYLKRKRKWLDSQTP